MEEISLFTSFLSPIYDFLIDLAEKKLLAPLVVALSIGLSYFGIVKTIKCNRNDVKDRATISYIMDRNKDNEFLQGLSTIHKIHSDDDVDIKKYANNDHRDTDEAKKIRYIANHYEYLSVGVFNNIYNEKMLKDSSQSTTVKMHRALKNYILAIREQRGNNKAYEHFDKLSKRWN